MKSKPLKSERDRQQVEKEKLNSPKPRKIVKQQKTNDSGFKVPQVVQPASK